MRAADSCTRTVALIALLSAALHAALNDQILVDTIVQISPPQITLDWAEQPSDSPDIQLMRRQLGDIGHNTWNTLGTFSPTTHLYVDSSVSSGIAYEYGLFRDNGGDYSDETGAYVCAGIDVPLVEDRGTVLFIVDATLATTLNGEIRRMEMDLVGDGWTVVRHDFDRHGTGDPLALKNWISDQYHATSANVQSVYLFGRLPIVKSGYTAPDGHGSVPHATDLFYTDLDGTWTDSSYNVSGNTPGDGVYDQNNLPGPNYQIKIPIGRVDLAGMTAWNRDEEQLLRDYLDKNHNFRHLRYTVPRIACYQGMGYDDSPVEASAVSSIVGGNNIEEGDLMDLGQSTPRLLGIGSADWKGSNYPNYRFKVQFTNNFASHKQKWDNSNNPMRAMLANRQYGLVCFWGARPNWYIHHLGLGRTIGYSQFRTANNNYFDNNQHLDYDPIDDYGNYMGSGIWINLMGDPTLRIHPVAPAQDLSASVASKVQLNWSSSSDAAVSGYHVYRSANRLGPYQRLNGSLLAGTNYEDNSPLSGSAWYMVRAYKLETYPGGSYGNMSQGLFVEVDASGGNTAPVADHQSVNTTDGDAISITLTGSDADSDPLTYSIASFPADGSISGTPPNLTYLPPVNFDGTATIGFQVWDGIAEGTGAVTVTVSNINHNPSGTNSESIVAKGVATSIAPPISDPDNDTLNYAIVSQAAEGSVVGGSSMSYTSASNFLGNDSWEWQADDGTTTSTTHSSQVLVVDKVEWNRDDFDDLDLTGWTAEVAIDGSTWSADAGTLDYAFNDGPAILSWDAPGQIDFINHALSATISSTDDDKLGLIFRYQDADNYYGFEMNSQGSKRQLFKVSSGSRSVLAQDTVAYNKEQAYAVEIYGVDGKLYVQIDNQIVMSADDDTTPPSGKVGVHSDDNKTSSFDDLVLYGIDSGNTGNNSPQIDTPAAADSNPVTGTSTVVSVSASDPDIGTTLSYDWNITTMPSGANPSFNDPSATSTTLTLDQAGNYDVEVQVTDGLATTTSSFTLTVDQTPSLTVTPASIDVPMGTEQTFTAELVDQFGDTMTDTVTWLVLAGGAGGSIDASGIYAAAATTGSDTIEATAAGTSDQATVTITPNLNMQAMTVSHEQIRLIWNNLTDADWYLLSRKNTTVSNQIGIILLPAGSDSYNDSQLQAEQDYSYRLSAGSTG